MTYTMGLFVQRECYKCGVVLMVPDYDVSVFTYCQPCAFAKLGMTAYDNRTEENRDDR